MLIYLVEDDNSIRELVAYTLQSAGFRAEGFEKPSAFWHALETQLPDLILLDLMLPKLDGLQVCQLVREFSDVPIVMLTAKGEDMDKILGLEYGADDHITTPFNIREVASRIKAILRRVNPTPKGNSDVLISGDITLDYNFRRIKIKDKTIELTGKEFELMDLFVKNAGRVYTRENLLDIAWGVDYPGDVRTVDVHIRRLREKIEENPAEPLYIMTKWGVGYYYKKD